MPLKMTVGISRDLLLPDDGMVTVSCSLDVRLDVAAMNGDGERFDRAAENAFVICQEAIRSGVQKLVATHSVREPLSQLDRQFFNLDDSPSPIDLA